MCIHYLALMLASVPIVVITQKIVAYAGIVNEALLIQYFVMLGSKYAM